MNARIQPRYIPPSDVTSGDSDSEVLGDVGGDVGVDSEAFAVSCVTTSGTLVVDDGGGD